MEQSGNKDHGSKNIYDIKTFPVPFKLGEIKENLTLNTKTLSQASKEQIINQAIKFHTEGNIAEAGKYYKQLIKQGCNDHRVFSNYGVILKNIGKLKEAELSTRKAIALNPDYAKAHFNLGGILIDLGRLKEAELSTRKAIALNPHYAKAHFNLGNILIDLGKLKEAELSTRKAIALNPHYAKAYYSLSLLKYSNKDMIWRDQLFSEGILKNKSQREKVDIYFAKANILHKEKNYKESAKHFKFANQLKLILNPSNADNLINKSKELLIESEKKENNQKEYTESQESIFIVGMPRSGSTLLESIITMNTNIKDLGESQILEESFLESKQVDQQLTLAELYWKKIKDLNQKANKTTNKNLYNYLYTGIIAKKIPTAKIIHCYRNPLDNILSIYRAHFLKGNDYSSSLVDCARVYLDQENIMTEYKKSFRSKIYDLNYDLLVTNPNKEIKSLVSWLDWEWDDSYLSPHLNTRSVSTASNVQVRSQINSKSVGGWKNYKEMLKTSIEILAQTDRYRNLIS
ncbi:tetratricopeptide repeat-containing sulfotransferase family protein [Prochlorococcus marinus]|uniref:tetratricopeptide repeat-containing sulfotransferase family protein n=1 Tax=Prochlorococcus marinus TaxID=1219 RepID=UPI0022B5D72B|nr:tetratricopeptide repeat-containing sulfotransferase family protein [Prochlorococcus marinus]